MPFYGYIVLAVGYLLWLTAFLFAQRTAQPAKHVDKRARWGIALVAAGFALLWQGQFWQRPLQRWRLALSVAFFLLAALLSWTGTRALGRQWRIDAGLNADHELITSGPYRYVRHPIYTSMLCVLCATGVLLTPWWLFLPAIVLFICGTEIRVRTEENLLAPQFGERFAEYKRRVPAYIPFSKLRVSRPSLS